MTGDSFGEHGLESGRIAVALRALLTCVWVNTTPKVIPTSSLLNGGSTYL